MRALSDAIADPRDPTRITFPMSCLFFVGVLLFLLRLGARRQVGLSLRNGHATANIAALFNVPCAPHGDTLDATYRRVQVGDVQEAQCRCIDALVRRKVLDPFRLLTLYLVVAADGSEVASFSKPHCPHCLHQTHEGKTTYSHKVLEAKIVTPTGLAFSLMTEFIENEAPDVKKQDCELRAFYRLADRLARRFPRLPIVLTLDGMFAVGPVFELCRQHRWDFVIVLKDGDLPSVEREFEALDKLEPRRLRVRSGPNETIEQTFRWQNDIDYVDTNRKEHTLGVVECVDRRTEVDDTHKTRTFKWVTSLRLSKHNVSAIANDGGRIRWRIENEGFNTQKNGGYGLEHVYSKDPNAAKVFYLLLQVAHTVHQLIESASLLRHAARGDPPTGVDLARRLFEAWRNALISPAMLADVEAGHYQIRLRPP